MIFFSFAKEIYSIVKMLVKDQSFYKAEANAVRYLLNQSLRLLPVLGLLKLTASWCLNTVGAWETDAKGQ